MRRLLLTSVALTVLATTSALAADLRRAPPAAKAPLPAPIPIFSWTGCYVGGHVGGLWATKDWDFRDPQVAVVNHENHGEHDASGWVAGVQGGCDYQFGRPGGGFVIGIAGDYAWANAEGEHTRFFTLIGENALFHSEVDSVASITVRLGWAIDRFLVYVKGGFAWESDNFHVRASTLGDQWDASDTRTGWTVGIGGEYAFTTWVSAFVEANWYNFDNEDLRFNHTPVNLATGPLNWNIEDEKFVVKGGLNLRFGGLWGPPPARY